MTASWGLAAAAGGTGYLNVGGCDLRDPHRGHLVQVPSSSGVAELMCCRWMSSKRRGPGLFFSFFFSLERGRTGGLGIYPNRVSTANAKTFNKDFTAYKDYPCRKKPGAM